MGLRSHFPKGSAGVDQDLAWVHLRHCASLAAGVAGALGPALAERSLAALLLELVAMADAPGTTRRQPAEDFLRLRDAIEDGRRLVVMPLARGRT